MGLNFSTGRNLLRERFATRIVHKMLLSEKRSLARIASLSALGISIAAAEVSAASIAIGSQPETSTPTVTLRSFADWKAACGRLPSNRTLKGRMPPKNLLALPNFLEVGEVFSAFFEQCKTGILSRTNSWIGELPSIGGFFNTNSAYFLQPGSSTAGSSRVSFQPFAQKLIVPEGAEIIFHADLHGDIRSLMADLTWLNEHGYLEGFSLSRPDRYMIFLGDYTDRGSYGVEVLYTLLRLKLANPGRVFLARGNHEEYSLQSRYGFLSEGQVKYGANFDAKAILRAYDFLPVVIYLGSGSNFIQCNHGGMEPGFNPRRLLNTPGAEGFQFLGALNQRQFLTGHPKWFADADRNSSESASRSLRDFRPLDPINPSVLGFMWNDYSVLASDPQFAIDPGRAFVYGQRATQFLLNNGSSETNRLQAVFRGHQQSSVLNPMMRRLIASRGVFRHWQTNDSAELLNADPGKLEKILERADERAVPLGSVWTFNVSPDSVYGEGCGYSFDTMGILKTARNFADWRLRVVNVAVQP